MEDPESDDEFFEPQDVTEWWDRPGEYHIHIYNPSGPDRLCQRCDTIKFIGRHCEICDKEGLLDRYNYYMGEYYTNEVDLEKRVPMPHNMRWIKGWFEGRHIMRRRPLKYEVVHWYLINKHLKEFYKIKYGSNEKINKINLHYYLLNNIKKYI